MMEIPTFDKYNGEKQIAILDNSSIEFLHELDKNGINTVAMLCVYDAIFIPQWVMNEVEDSIFRVQYIEKMYAGKLPLYLIKEKQYADIANGEELNLYHIVYASVSQVSEVMKYLRMHVRKDDLLEIEAYEDWIGKMYDDWPMKKVSSFSGKEIRKNAGEISITILAEVISWYCPNVDTLTVYTQDADTLAFQTKADVKLKKRFKSELCIPVGYKTNDAILYQLYREGLITDDSVKIYRKNERSVTYTKEHEDMTITIEKKKISTEQFVDLLKDDTVSIVF